MKILRCGEDLGIEFDNGNFLYDYHNQKCCECNPRLSETMNKKET